MCRQSIGVNATILFCFVLPRFLFTNRDIINISWVCLFARSYCCSTQNLRTARTVGCCGTRFLVRAWVGPEKKTAVALRSANELDAAVGFSRYRQYLVEQQGGIAKGVVAGLQIRCMGGRHFIPLTDRPAALKLVLRSILKDTRGLDAFPPRDTGPLLACLPALLRS